MYCVLPPGCLLFFFLPKSRKPKSDLSHSWLFCHVPSLSGHQLIIITNALLINSLTESPPISYLRGC